MGIGTNWLEGKCGVQEPCSVQFYWTFDCTLNINSPLLAWLRAAWILKLFVVKSEFRLDSTTKECQYIQHTIPHTSLTILFCKTLFCIWHYMLKAEKAEPWVYRVYSNMVRTRFWSNETNTIKIFILKFNFQSWIHVFAMNQDGNVLYIFHKLH